jgi:filamentous hemagglutinin family protein
MLPGGFYRLKFIAKIIIGAILSSISSQQIINAQVISDDTTRSQIEVENNLLIITGGTVVGENLFHSFKEFSVSTDAIAYFNNASTIENIFSRITGGSVSEINGLIRSNGNASLFLLNPAGIIFGEKAQLNIGGSFIATTADRLIFADGIIYSATVSNDTKPLLTINTPLGLQFQGNSGGISTNSGDRVTRSNLRLAPNNTLALIGGRVNLERLNAIAFDGNIEIASVAKGIVSLQFNSDRGWQLDYEDVSQFDRLALESTFIDTSGSQGFSRLTGKTIDLTVGSTIRNFTIADGNGGKIELLATEAISLDNSSLFTQVGVGFDPNILGKGGDLEITAPQVTFNNGSAVSAGTIGLGAGGNIRIQASELLQLSGGSNKIPSLLSTSTQGQGNGGQIDIHTGSLLVLDGSQIQAFAGEGSGGQISIEATKEIELSGTGTLRLFDPETANISFKTLNSGILASSGAENLPFELQPSGKSGNSIVTTPKLSISEGAEISVSNFGPANAGNIEINASQLNLTSVGKIVANTASGTGGSLKINSEYLILRDRGEISTTARRNGNGGNININTDNLVLLESSTIHADAQEGTGGNIAIDTRGFFIAADSGITASSNFGTDGIVEIVTPEVNSKLETYRIEPSPLAAEDRIATGCGLGANFIKNQFRYTGRGGLPPNPLEGTINNELISDLGFSEQFTADDRRLTSNSTFHLPSLSDNALSIQEANTWIVNDRGKIELVAPTINHVQLSLTACN